MNQAVLLSNITTQLFTNWELDTWANVLELVGFIITVISLVIAALVKSEINKLKVSYIFDQRIKGHIKKLTKCASNLNNFLNDYDNNRRNIAPELVVCATEMHDLKSKLSFWDKRKISKVQNFIEERANKEIVTSYDYKYPLWKFLVKFPNRIYKTTIDDIYTIHSELHGIIHHVTNIKKNKSKSL